MQNEIPDLPPFESFIPKYMSYVPGRGRWKAKYRGFKPHSGLNHAKNAISNALYSYGMQGSSHRMMIWEFDFTNLSWNLLYDIAPHTLLRDLPWRKK